jgi:transcriptional regulator of arginine metabolism
MNKNTKKNRQKILKSIITKQEIGDQVHLLEALKECGIDATQASISRDLQELGVVKVRLGSSLYKYEILEKISGDVILDKLKVLFDNFVSGIKRTGNLVLVKCSAGNANGVGSYIDRLQRPEIMGTVAGDDTILVVVDTAENGQKVEDEFIRLLRPRTKNT